MGRRRLNGPRPFTPREGAVAAGLLRGEGRRGREGGGEQGGQTGAGEQDSTGAAGYSWLSHW